MKILVTGAGGQLAWELERSVPQGCQLTCLGREQLDIGDPDAVADRVTELRPHAIINAAAYTAVDRAEEDRDTAMKVNGAGAANLARISEDLGIYLLHISTDFVFDGRGNRPYGPSDPVNPLNVYGASKLAGERALMATMSSNWCILRTSWVYSTHGGNFVKTMLRLMHEKPALRVVSDQIGTPTWAAGLAEVCWAAVEARLGGTYHWSDAGVASWYDFAVVIQKLAVDKGLLRDSIPITPVRTADYPTPATRPTYSVLDKTQLLAALPSVTQRHWLEQVSQMLDQL